MTNVINLGHLNKAEQTAGLAVGGRYDGEAAPAATSCSLSGEAQPLAHLSLQVVRVCGTKQSTATQ